MFHSTVTETSLSRICGQLWLWFPVSYKFMDRKNENTILNKHANGPLSLLINYPFSISAQAKFKNLFKFSKSRS